MKTPIDNLENLTRCPSCNAAYGRTKAVLLESDQKRTTFHLTCTKCQASALIFVSVNQFGVVSTGTLTDLDAQEAKRLFNKEAVSSDQVLAVYEYLKNI